jgi:hypothetical protein
VCSLCTEQLQRKILYGIRCTVCPVVLGLTVLWCRPDRLAVIDGVPRLNDSCWPQYSLYYIVPELRRRCGHIFADRCTVAPWGGEADEDAHISVRTAARASDAVCRVVCTVIYNMSVVQRTPGEAVARARRERHGITYGTASRTAAHPAQPPAPHDHTSHSSTYGDLT